MKSLVNIAALTVALICTSTLTSCAGNPQQVAKERDRADDRRKDAEDDNDKLSDQNALLKNMLTHVIATTNDMWVLAGLGQDQQEAIATCDVIGFSLPSTAQFAEFKAEVYDLSSDWQKVSADAFHTTDAAAAVEDTLLSGMTLCRRDRTTPFID